MEERKLTNEEHILLWDQEYNKWKKSRPRPLSKILALLFFWFFCVMGSVAAVVAVITIIKIATIVFGGDTIVVSNTN